QIAIIATSQRSEKRDQRRAGGQMCGAPSNRTDPPKRSRNAPTRARRPLLGAKAPAIAGGEAIVATGSSPRLRAARLPTTRKPSAATPRAPNTKKGAVGIE